MFTKVLKKRDTKNLLYKKVTLFDKCCEETYEDNLCRAPPQESTFSFLKYVRTFAS